MSKVLTPCLELFGSLADLLSRRMLEATLSKALKLKYARFGFEARLMLAELNIRSNQTGARSQLQSLELEARRRRFLYIAERAAGDLRLSKPFS
jgi:hypothetical protein